MKESLYENIETELDEDEGSWAISYADMITVLLGFFVIFFSFNFKEIEKKKETANIVDVLSFSSLRQQGEDLKANTGVNANKVIDYESFSTVARVLSSDEVMIYFPGLSFFNTGSTELTSEGREALKEFLVKFEQLDGNFSIELYAYTDDQPVGQSSSMYRNYADNTELSALRAVSVLKFFKKNGVHHNAVDISGGGVLKKEFLENIIPKEKRAQGIDRSYYRTVGLKVKRES